MEVSASSPLGGSLGVDEHVLCSQILLISVEHLEVRGNQSVAFSDGWAVAKELDHFVDVVKEDLHQGPVSVG